MNPPARILYICIHLTIAAAYSAAINTLGVPWAWPAYLLVWMLCDGFVQGLVRAWVRW